MKFDSIFLFLFWKISIFYIIVACPFDKWLINFIKGKLECFKNSNHLHDPSSRRKATQRISKIGLVEITCNSRLVVAFCATKFTVPPGVSTPERILLSWVLKLYVFLHNWKLEIIIVAPSGTSRYGTKPYESALGDRPHLCKDLFGK